MLSPSERLWPWLHRLYWKTALCVVLGLALPQLLLGERAGQAAAASYLLAGLAAFPLARLYPKAALVAHLLAGLAAFVWVANQPWAAVAPGWDREMALYVGATLATLGLTVLAVFGGLWAMVAGLALLAALLPHPASALYWVAFPLWLTGGLVGLALNRGIHRLERAGLELARAALRDRQTGLGSRAALEADYERYQAIASREDQPLLLSFWILRAPAGPAQKALLAENLAQTMREAVRQGDGLYRVDERRFSGLHLGLANGNELAERLGQRFAQVQAVWVVCNGLTLEEAMAQAEGLLIPHPRHPVQPAAAVPKA